MFEQNGGRERLPSLTFFFRGYCGGRQREKQDPDQRMHNVAQRCIHISTKSNSEKKNLFLLNISRAPDRQLTRRKDAPANSPLFVSHHKLQASSSLPLVTGTINDRPGSIPQSLFLSSSPPNPNNRDRFLGAAVPGERVSNFPSPN